jgi:hypothetical protein
MRYADFHMCRVNHAPQNERLCYGSLSLEGDWQHFETLHGIVPGPILVREASYRRPLGTFHPQLRRHRAILTAKQDIGSTY